MSVGEHSVDGGVYTTQGLMFGNDLEEYRLDTDWYELNRREPENDECEHLRLLTDDCDECERY
jgi:hypothetical protein